MSIMTFSVGSINACLHLLIQTHNIETCLASEHGISLQDHATNMTSRSITLYLVLGYTLNFTHLDSLLT